MRKPTYGLRVTLRLVATATTADTLEWQEDYPTIIGTIGMCDALDRLYAGDPDAAEPLIALTTVAVQTWGAAHPGSVT